MAWAGTASLMMSGGVMNPLGWSQLIDKGTGQLKTGDLSVYRHGDSIVVAIVPRSAVSRIIGDNAWVTINDHHPWVFLIRR